MNILHLISSGGMYGAEAVILSLCQELQASGAHTASLAVFANPDHSEPELVGAARAAGIATHLVHCYGQLDLTVARQLRTLCAGLRIDALHAHGYKADIYAACALGTRPRPALISTCHTWYDNDLALRLYGAADRWVLQQFEQVVAVSDEVQRRLLDSGVQPGRTHLIRNGVRMQPLLAASADRQRTRPADGTLRIGLVGRFAPEKGIDDFLRAAAMVHSKAPGTSFSIAGDGPDRPQLEVLARSLGLVGSVHMPGRQEDMPAFYTGLDILVSSSLREGLPVALLEGMASGLPVVATRAGAVPQVVVPGETGLLVTPGDPSALAQAILELAQDTARREAFGIAAQRRIAEHFSAARMASEYLAVYARALRLHPQPAAARGLAA